ncbi:hypothetical protein BV898_17852 [Hypsibius exemplaris]|uniref:Uncharacterized protein n=1 Tax=Hypsibius exemplaris TaxID=2072580 RepID=A0A9X6RMY0_HYPEX|nr:hypothetical protein BV898_17852 [Hypsibius exemplaris]
MREQQRHARENEQELFCPPLFLEHGVDTWMAERRPIPVPSVQSSCFDGKLTSILCDPMMIIMDGLIHKSSKRQGHNMDYNYNALLGDNNFLDRQEEDHSSGSCLFTVNLDSRFHIRHSTSQQHQLQLRTQRFKTTALSLIVHDPRDSDLTSRLVEACHEDTQFIMFNEEQGLLLVSTPMFTMNYDMLSELQRTGKVKTWNNYVGDVLSLMSRLLLCELNENTDDLTGLQSQALDHES